MQVLDLESNRVSGLDQLDALGTCLCLSEVVLRGNPVALRHGYRRIVFHLIPHLSTLDGAGASPADLALVCQRLRVWVCMCMCVCVRGPA